MSYTGTSAINLGGNLTTSGGAITLTGPVTLTGDTIADTSNAGATPAGANITLSSTCNGAKNFTLNGGTEDPIISSCWRDDTFNHLYHFRSHDHSKYHCENHRCLELSGITAINLGGNITTSGGTIGLTGPVTLNANAVLDATNAGVTASGANITLATSVDGAKTLTLTGGTSGTVAFGAIGGTTALTTFTTTGATITQNASVKTIGVSSYNGTTAIGFGWQYHDKRWSNHTDRPCYVNWEFNCRYNQCRRNSSRSKITISSTCNGAKNFTLTGGTGGVLSFGAIGGTTALTTFTTTGATITQNATAKTTGALSYTGTTVINLGGNITTSGSSNSLTGPVTLNANAV